MIRKKSLITTKNQAVVCWVTEPYQRDTEDADVQDEEGLWQEKGTTRGIDPHLSEPRGFSTWQAYRQLSVSAALSSAAPTDLTLPRLHPLMGSFSPATPQLSQLPTSLLHPRVGR